MGMLFKALFAREGGEKFVYRIKIGLKSAIGRDVTKRAIINVNSIVSGRNYYI